MNRTGAVGWTQYSFSYTALSSRPILVFGFRGFGSSINYLDGVSLVDNTSPAVEILQNPSFESSSSTLPGWVTWCQANCAGSNDEGQVTGSSCRLGSGSLCYKDACQMNGDYLGQSFAAIVGRTYTISFWLQMTGTWSRFFADVAY